ncbi:MAG: DNA polymerase I [Spirochaetales bacterium]|nr:DNA polymerase I [Spirochaetales bacterium]
MNNDKSPLYLLDGYSLIYRTYFAFINRPLVNSKGNNISVVFGFFRNVFNLIEKYGVENFAVVMDSPVPTFRHEMYSEYKANREKAPDDLHAQVPIVVEILKAANIPMLRADRFEADDIIAFMARKCSAEERKCSIVTGDKDLLQLVDSWVEICKPDKDGYLRMGPDSVKEVWGVEPEQILDYLALTGDSSDNIPGVRGIGPKTAVNLLGKYRDLDGVYAHLDELTKGQKQKLEDDRESAYMSRELVRLAEDVPVDVEPEALSLRALDKAATLPIFEREEVWSLVKKISGSDSSTSSGGPAVSSPDGASDSSSGRGAESPGGVLSTELPFEKPAPPETVEYVAVTNPDLLDEWIEKCKSAGVFAFDSETDNLDEMLATPVGFSLSCEEGRAAYIPLKAEGCDCLAEELVRNKLGELLATPGIKVIGQNIKYDYKVLKRWGVNIPVIGFDTMVAAWLLDAQGLSGMDALAMRYLGVETIHFKDIVPKGATFDQVPIKQAADYAAEDADITLRLYNLFSGMIEEAGFSDLYYKLELPLIPILAEMELAGIIIKSEALLSFRDELGQRLEKIETEIYGLCGHEFNINSPKQLQVVLFEERKLKPGKKTKTGYSTDVKVLEQLSAEDPVPALILQHRSLAKLKSTYADALPQLENKETGRLHTRFIQTGTATGRMSSKDPNLQNIPIKTEDGRKIRSAFVPAPGHVFLSADYSQIELVVLAHLSGDKALSAAFLDKQDVHSQTASLIFGCFPEMVTPDQRRIAKTINFGVMYGMSAFRLSRELDIPRGKADEFIKSYFARFAGITRFIDDTVAAAEKDGVVSTLLGRKREIRGINSRNKTEKAGAERIAVNTPIQGSAADIVKLAMLAVSARLEKEGLKSRVLLQVHDEILLEVPLEEKDIVETVVREEMEGAYALDVPLKVSIEIGNNWGEFH